MVNTNRVLQFHEKALRPAGQAESDAWILYQLGRYGDAEAALRQAHRLNPADHNIACNLRRTIRAAAQSDV